MPGRSLDGSCTLCRPGALLCTCSPGRCTACPAVTGSTTCSNGKDFAYVEEVAVTSEACLLEHAIHGYFAALRGEGEWFRPDLALLEHILKMRSATGGRTPEGLPEQMDLLELRRMVRRLKRAASPVAVPVAVTPDLSDESSFGH